LDLSTNEKEEDFIIFWAKNIYVGAIFDLKTPKDFLNQPLNAQPFTV